MKKIILTLAIILGACAFANANNALKENVSNAGAPVISQQEILVYHEIKFEELSETIQKVVISYEEKNEVIKIEYNDEKQFTKLTLKSKEDGTIFKVVLNKDGLEQ